MPYIKRFFIAFLGLCAGSIYVLFSLWTQPYVFLFDMVYSQTLFLFVQVFFLGIGGRLLWEKYGCSGEVKKEHTKNRYDEGKELLGKDKQEPYLPSFLWKLFIVCVFAILLSLSFQKEYFYENIFVVYAFMILLSSTVLTFPFIQEWMQGKLDNSLFFRFVYSISQGGFISFLLGSILFILSTITLFGIQGMFDISQDILFRLIGTFAVISSFFSGTYFLKYIPSIRAFEMHVSMSSVFFVCITYICVPFVVINTVLVHIHIVLKVLFGQGDIFSTGWFIAVSLMIGYFAYLYSFPYEKHSRGISLFRMLFPLFALFESIFFLYFLYIRIAFYDVTVNRYIAGMFGGVFFLSSLYFLISQKKHLLVMFLFSSLFVIFASIGPWSVFVFPQERQFQKILTLLKEEGMLEGPKNTVSFHTGACFSGSTFDVLMSSISYMCRNVYTCNKIVPLFESSLTWKDTYIDDGFLSQDLILLSNGNRITRGEFISALYQLFSPYVCDRIYEEAPFYHVYQSDTVFPFRGGNTDMIFLKMEHMYDVEVISLNGEQSLSGLVCLYAASCKRIDSLLNERPYHAFFDSTKKELYILSGGRIMETISLQEFDQSLQRGILSGKTLRNVSPYYNASIPLFSFSGKVVDGIVFWENYTLHTEKSAQAFENAMYQDRFQGYVLIFPKMNIQ